MFTVRPLDLIAGCYRAAAYPFPSVECLKTVHSETATPRLVKLYKIDNNWFLRSLECSKSYESIRCKTICYAVPGRSNQTSISVQREGAKRSLFVVFVWVVSTGGTHIMNNTEFHKGFIK